MISIYIICISLYYLFISLSLSLSLSLVFIIYFVYILTHYTYMVTGGVKNLGIPKTGQKKVLYRRRRKTLVVNVGRYSIFEILRVLPWC